MVSLFDDQNSRWIPGRGLKGFGGEVLVAMLFLLARFPNAAGASFQNLDFERADTNQLRNVFCNPNPLLGVPFFVCYGSGATEDLLPGWTLTLGGTPVTAMTFNDVSESTGYAFVMHGVDGQLFQPDGLYGLGLVPPRSGNATFALSQSGLIPLGAVYLTYRFQGRRLDLTINDEPVGAVGTPAASGYEITTAYYDVSAFVGQEVNLTLSTPIPGLIEPSNVNLDSIAFIPEPRISCLLGIGAVVLLGQTLRGKCGASAPVTGKSWP